MILLMGTSVHSKYLAVVAAHKEYFRANLGEDLWTVVQVGRKVSKLCGTVPTAQENTFRSSANKLRNLFFSLSPLGDAVKHATKFRGIGAERTHQSSCLCSLPPWIGWDAFLPLHTKSP